MERIVKEIIQLLDQSEQPFTLDLESISLELLPEYEAIDALPDCQESEAA